MESGALLFQSSLHRPSGLLRQQGRQTPTHGVDGFDREPTIQQIVGKFTADQPGADDGHLLCALGGQQILKTSVVVEVIHAEHVISRITPNRGPNQFRTQCQH